MTKTEAIKQTVSEVAEHLGVSEIEAASKLQATAVKKGREDIAEALHDYKMDLIGRQDLRTDSQK